MAKRQEEDCLHFGQNTRNLKAVLALLVLCLGTDKTLYEISYNPGVPEE